MLRKLATGTSDEEEESDEKSKETSKSDEDGKGQDSNHPYIKFWEQVNIVMIMMLAMT